MVLQYGLYSAYLFAYFLFVSKKLPKDRDGYFSFDASYALNGIGIPKRTFVRYRQKLVDHGLIEFIPGNNQNARPRYKVLK